MQPSAMPTTSGQALQNVQQYQSGMQTPTQELQGADQSLGVTQAQQTVQGLQGAINNTTNLLNQVVPTVEGNTQNSLVTSSQANQQEANAEAPLQSSLSQDEQSYNAANSNYTDLESQAEDEANANETAQENQLSYLQGVYNDLYTQEQNAAQAATQQSQFTQQLDAQEQEYADELAANSSGGITINDGDSGVTSSGGSNASPAAPYANPSSPAKVSTFSPSNIFSEIGNVVKTAAKEGPATDIKNLISRIL